LKAVQTNLIKINKCKAASKVYPSIIDLGNENIILFIDGKFNSYDPRNLIQKYLYQKIFYCKHDSSIKV